MTRPQIIRADTIDLQNQDAPSAKDHSRQPTHPGPLGDGPPAPHQAGALRSVGHELGEHHVRSPRASQDLSGKELQLLHEDNDGTNEEQRNRDSGGSNGEDGDMGEVEGGDGMDDDMMDKISSSPSIDDGGYSLPFAWPPREASLLSTPSSFQTSQSQPTAFEENSSSPYVSTLVHVPLSLTHKEEGPWSPEVHHHQMGLYPEHQSTNSFSNMHADYSLDVAPHIDNPAMSCYVDELETIYESYDEDPRPGDLHLLLLPLDDPLLDYNFDDPLSSPPFSPPPSPRSSCVWAKPQDQNDDEAGGVSFVQDPRFIDSGWGGECLREIEDIDFEFVYALHTFVATVEGQANATKGDTMVLLDDSNSYWWLVRVVKDSSIGYLPAEHIETPTERLARLNKHRNIDLSQTMLGDNPEKSINPLKKAMRRRNAKTVQFTAPTYYEASDIEYSSDEEGDEGVYPEFISVASTAVDQDSHEGHDQSVTVEPLKVGGHEEQTDIDDAQVTSVSRDVGADAPAEAEMSRSSEDLFGNEDDASSSKSRKGTVRNTDSFFKDDTLETRKINLTPSLLRDDTNTSNSIAITSESKEIKTRGSLDALEKVASPEKSKDEKRKEKKPGMLSGFFKRKDKKSKSQAEDEDSEALSKENSRQSPQPNASSDSISQDGQFMQSSPQQRQQPQRQSSKLQKTPPKFTLSTKRPPSREGQNVERGNAAEISSAMTVQSHHFQSELADKDHLSAGDATNADSIPENISSSLRIISPDRTQNQINPPSSPVESKSRGRMFSPIRDVLRSSPAATESKPEKVKQAKQRVAMDDFDSSPEADDSPDPLQQVRKDYHPIDTRPLPAKERLSESPIQVSPVGATHLVEPPPLVRDSPSPEEPSISPMSSTSTPEFIEAPPEEGNRDETTPVSTGHSSTNAPTWRDAGLRSYIEDDTDVRDLLVLVYDKSDAKPAGPDHPMSSMCREENRKLGEMSSRLDGLLHNFLARKAKNGAR